MQQFASIAINGFMELARQPVVLLLTTTTAIVIPFLASIPYFGFGEDRRMVKDTLLAVMLLSGLIGSVLSASNTLAREIRSGTALVVLSKPVGRATFLLARYAGLTGILTVTSYVSLLACLLGSRLAYDAFGNADLRTLGIYYAAMAVAYLGAAFSNYFLRRPFVSDAFASLIVLLTLAFIGVNFFDGRGQPQAFGEGIDWRMVPAGVLILFSVWMLAALALACSTRLEMMATLLVCSGVFLLGLMSDYFLSQDAAGGRWWAGLLYVVLPNWQKFWVADALGEGYHVPWSYVATSLGYALMFVGAAMAAGLALFEDRELN